MKEDRVEAEGADLLERQLTEAVGRNDLEIPGDHADSKERNWPRQPNRLHRRSQRDCGQKQRREDKEMREEVGEGVHRGLPTRLPGAPQ